MSALYRKIIKRNLSRYNTTKEDINYKVADDLIFNEKKHIVSIFKDFLILNESCDFITKYNSIYDSLRTLSFICIDSKGKKFLPTFVDLIWNKKINKSIRLKANAIPLVDDPVQKIIIKNTKAEPVNKYKNKKEEATTNKMLKRILTSSLMKNNSSLIDIDQSNTTIKLDIKDNFIRGCKDFSDKNDIVLLKYLLLPKKKQSAKEPKKILRQSEKITTSRKSSQKDNMLIYQNLQNHSKIKSSLYKKEFYQPLMQRASTNSPNSNAKINKYKITKSITLNTYTPTLSKIKSLKKSVNTTTNTTTTIRKNTSSNKSPIRARNTTKITKNISYTPLQYQTLQSKIVNKNKKDSQVYVSIKNKLNTEMKHYKSSYTFKSNQNSNQKDIQRGLSTVKRNQLKKKLFEPANTTNVTQRKTLMLNSNKTFYSSTFRTFDNKYMTTK